MPTIKDVIGKIEEREEIAALEAAAAQAAAEEAVEDMLEAANDLAAYANALLGIVGKVTRPLNRVAMLRAANADVSKDLADNIFDSIDGVQEEFGWLFEAMNRAGVVATDDDDDDAKACGCPGCAAARAETTSAPNTANTNSPIGPKGAAHTVAILRKMIAEDLGIPLPR